MRDEKTHPRPSPDPRGVDMTTDCGECGTPARFVARFTWARLPFFVVSLLAALIVLQELVALVAHQIPLAARPLWLVPAKLLLGALMLWLYCGEVHYFERRDVAELARDRAAWRVAAGIVLGAALFSIVFALLAVGGYVQNLRFGGITGLPAQLATSFAAAVGEELVFRGAIYRITDERFGTAAALLVSSVLFGLLHAANSGATPVSTVAIALEAGALLGMAYSSSRSLWLPMGLHFGWNFTEGGVFGTDVSGGQSHGLIESVLSGPTLVTGGAFGPEASVIAVAVCLAATAVIGLWTVRHGRWRPWRRETVL
jgi:membrane protease YdiL (CAAX protease family)